MKIYLRTLIFTSLLGCITTSVSASKINFCVLDLMGSNGDIMSIARDYALAAKQWGVTVQLAHYSNVKSAMQDFDQKKCTGLVADNFATKKYNHFMGTIGAVGAIPNYDVAQKVLTALSSPKLAGKLKNKSYEVVGYVPYGLTYFHLKDRSVKTVDDLNNKKLGVLEVDISQRRMAQKVGMQPIGVTFDNAVSKFRDNDIEVLPAPLVVYQPLEVGKILGDQGGIINYPLALFTMNFILADGNYPADFGQKSRQWFSQRSPQLIKTVERWDTAIPKNKLYDIPAIDHLSYDRLLSQLRKEFIDNNVYDQTMISLIRHIRCGQDPKFIECR